MCLSNDQYSTQPDPFHRRHSTREFTKRFPFNDFGNVIYRLISVRLSNRTPRSSLECAQDVMTKSAGLNRRDRERKPETLRNSICEVASNFRENEKKRR